MTRNAFVPASPHVLEDLQARLDLTRLVPVTRTPGAAGVDLDWLQAKLNYWRQGYSWPEQEVRIAELPWQETEHTAVPIRAIVTPAGPTAPVLLLLHGWPDSVLRFTRILPRLTSVTTVVPALPGYPFAAPVATGGMTAIDMADALVDAMAEFGFSRFTVSAGDVGCDVAEAIAGRHPDVVEALHLTDVSQFHYLADPPSDPTAEEQAYIDHGHHWQATEGAYMQEQSTKPWTLAIGLGDSPAGLAAWILEKLTTWSDCNGDLSRVFNDDEALTWVSAYWMTSSIGTSFATYASGRTAFAAIDWSRIQAPTVFTTFPKDLVNAPRHFAERYFNVVDWLEFEHGGHFAAWEHPDDYLTGINAALAHAQPHGAN